MFNRSGLDRFKKAQSLEPFSVNVNPVSKAPSQLPQQPVSRTFQSQVTQPQVQYQQHHGLSKPAAPEPTPTAAHATGIGGGQSNWQPPDWSVEPRPGVYRLEVVKDGEVLDHINLDKRRHIFGRQVVVCDFVLDHPSVSRQHAAVVQHKNGSIYVIDLGSVHGTFVANERLTKDNPVELEVGQSLRFAASSRSYILRKNSAASLPSQQLPAEFTLPPPPDPSDEEAVVAYNTLLNRFGASRKDIFEKPTGVAGMISSSNKDLETPIERASKRRRKVRVAFRDQHGGELVEVVGISDGADVSTEPGPIGVKEGSLVGKYESLVQVTVIPKGQDQVMPKEENDTPKGVTQKLQQCLNKVKSPAKGGFYEDLYGDSFAGQVGASWANTAKGNNFTSEQAASSAATEILENGMSKINPKNSEINKVSAKFQNSKANALFDDDDDLFGDSMEDDTSR
uniref:FHA domain-containing protein n=1 Tax=Araucaria cunninghamii TaxID=56994 RepID=A0A0D6RA07_ARACU